MPHTEGAQKKGKGKTTKQGNAIKETQEATQSQVEDNGFQLYEESMTIESDYE